MKFVFLVFAIFSFIFLHAGDQLSQTNNRKAKNIILLIGDGMGSTHAFAAYTANGGQLNMYRMPYLGMSMTQSSDNYITDSAAGGTAISSGKKTKNGMIAKDTSGNNLETILEIAKSNHLATGIVATSAITHATPASFFAHVNLRSSYDSIALFFLNGKADLFIGGGTDYFLRRKDKRNLVKELETLGYGICFTLDSVQKLSSKKIGCLLAPDGMPKYSEGRNNMLPTATHLAIEKLSKDTNGFFLMVEGSQIDWGAHANDLSYLIAETQDFDKAVGEALDFASKNENTLVIVTADHETGGLTLGKGNLMKGEINGQFSTTYHTGTPVIVYSYGPGAQEFTGVFQNTEVFYKMLKAYDFPAK